MPRTLLFAAAAALLATACGVSAEQYGAERPEAECEWSLRCFEADVLAYRGWSSTERCLTDVGSRVAGEAARCNSYDDAAARDCLDGLAAATCPGAEDPLDPPEACSRVYTDCEGESDPGDE